MNSPVILVTGAGKGIGEATVRAILQKQVPQQNLQKKLQQNPRPRFVLTARTRADLERLQAECRSQGAECEILPMELTDAPSSPVDFAIQTFGHLDAVVHSAGVGRFGDFLSLTADDLRWVMQTNVEAGFLLMQSAYRIMQKQKSGDLVWITSVAAETPFEQSAIYCMSKYAQKGLIEVMRLYGRKDGIRVIEVRPGATLTPMWGKLDDETQGRMMRPEDIAQPIAEALALPRRATIEELVIRPLHGDL